MIRKFFCCLLLLNSFSVNPVLATDSDYSKAAGHSGAYINSPKVKALKCKIKTMDLSEKNNHLGWYTAWPMIVDYKTGRFAQIGYITSPAEEINQPIFYVAWSEDGKKIKIKYLPGKEESGNALYPGDIHEYALSLNIDGSVNVQIDGIKYLEAPEERIKIGISEGTGEFFSEGSNIGVDITTEFLDCYYKLKGDNEWRAMSSDKKMLLYYLAEGTVIDPLGENSFKVKGKIRKINKGRFLREIIQKK